MNDYTLMEKSSQKSELQENRENLIFRAFETSGVPNADNDLD